MAVPETVLPFIGHPHYIEKTRQLKPDAVEVASSEGGNE